jgi:hypothetical protein
MKRKPPMKKYQEGGPVSGTTFREREEIRNRERDRASAQRDYESRRSAGVAERARQRQAAADEDRRQRMESERETRRQRLATSRAQADVERFNRPPRVVPYQERLPAAPPASESPSGRAAAPQPAAGGGGAGGGGGGGGRATVAAPGSSPMPRGGDVITGGRGLVPQRGIPLTTPRMPNIGAAAGLTAMLGPEIASRTSDYVARRQADSDALYNAAELRRAASRAEPIQQDPESMDLVANTETAAAAAREASSLPTPPRPPANPPRRRAAAPRQSESDRLNDISLALIRGQRPSGEEATNFAKRMGIEGYKKGGMIGKKPVKKAAGGTVPKPKVPGRSAGRPATTVKPMGTRSMAKAAAPKKPVAMPAFKKGGKVAMKGKRK